MKYILILTSALVLSCSSEDRSLKIWESTSSKVLQDKDTTVQTDSIDKYDKKDIKFSYKPVYSPININKFSTVELKKLYNDLLVQDQQYRDSINLAGKSEKQINLFWKDIRRTNSLNQLILSAVVNKFGWPRMNKYGKESVKAAFLIVWHASIEFKKQHLSLFELGSKEDSLNLHYYKITKDRVLLSEWKEQQYNTHKRLDNGLYQINF